MLRAEQLERRRESGCSRGHYVECKPTIILMAKMANNIQQVKESDPSALFSTAETVMECWIEYGASQYRIHTDLLE